MAITLVTPLDREKLVPVDTGIIIDFTASPDTVDVNGTQVFNAGVFQASWTGSLINLTGGGKRLALTPPAEFTVGQIVSVSVEEVGGAGVAFVFQAGVRKITNTNNNTNPTINIASGSTYLGYVRETGELYVRFGDPPGPEVPLLTANIVDVAFDPVLNKIVVLFVNNGKVYVTTANPGDGPNSIIPPGEGQTPSKAVGLPFDSVSIDSLPGTGIRGLVSTFPRPIAPVVISIDPRVVRFARPTDTPESDYCVGFIPYKSSVAYSAGRFMPFVPLPPGAPYADMTDPAPTPRATYSAICVYERGQSPGLVYSERSAEDAVPGSFGGAGGADVQPVGGGGQGIRYVLAKEDFLPLKESVPLESLVISSLGGCGLRRVDIVKQDFLPIKEALPVDSVEVITISGTGIRCTFGR